jgi:hypothetical protein
MTQIDIDYLIKNDNDVFKSKYQDIIFDNLNLIFKSLNKELEQSNFKQDTEEATDYILSVNKICFAVRNRKYEYKKKYEDITIRCESNKNKKTELDKIKEGYGDVYLYCWQTEEENDIDSYVLVDLNKLRLSNILSVDRKILANRNDDAKFITISIDELDKINCLIKTTYYDTNDR